MKKNFTTVGIILSSIMVLPCCQKEIVVSEEVTALSKESAVEQNVPSESSNATLSETQVLIRKWTEWVFTRDVSLVPWDDATGDKQYAAQPYATGIMMLAGGSSPDLVNRAITISLSQYQYIFIPVVNVLNLTNDCYLAHPTNGNVPKGALTSPITEALNGKRNLVVNWDGSSLLPDKLQDLRANSGLWEFTIHPSWIEGCTDTSNTFYADGFWVKIPLTVGVHQLEVSGDLEFKRFKSDFSNHVIYTITVTE